MSETAEICTSKTKNIPEGVVMEILSRLPVKTLLRFKCVSKTWYQLFSTDSVFIKLHLDRCKIRNTNPGIIAQHRHSDKICFAEDPTAETQDAIWFETPFLARRYCRLVNVCNGLVCLTDDETKVYVWNPFTGDHIIIPVPPSPSLVSFGFHQGSNEYKILRIVTKMYLGVPQFESDVWVYTLGTHTWRILGDIMDYLVCRAFVHSTAIVNGDLHWIAPKGRPVHIPHVLVSFDLGNEIFQEIPQPNYGKFDGAEEDDKIMYTVGELSGLLCIFRNIWQPATKMEIWTMKEYGVVDSWSKQFVVSGVSGYKIPVAVAYNEETIILGYDVDCQLILYNPQTNSVTPIDKFGCEVYNMNNYTGSLVSPTIINGSRHSST